MVSKFLVFDAAKLGVGVLDVVPTCFRQGAFISHPDLSDHRWLVH